MIRKLWCRIFGHRYGIKFYLKDENGKLYEPMMFEAPEGELIKVYRSCLICGAERFDFWG